MKTPRTYIRISSSDIPGYEAVYNHFCATQIMEDPRPDLPTFERAFAVMAATPLPVYVSRAQIDTVRTGLAAQNFGTADLLLRLFPVEWRKMQIVTQIIREIFAPTPKNEVLTCPEVWMILVNAALPEGPQRGKEDLTSFLVRDIGYTP